MFPRDQRISISSMSNPPRSSSVIDYEEENGPLIMNFSPRNRTSSLPLTTQSTRVSKSSHYDEDVLVDTSPAAHRCSVGARPRADPRMSESQSSDEAGSDDEAKTPVSSKTNRSRYSCRTPSPLNILRIFPDGCPPAPVMDFNAPVIPWKLDFDWQTPHPMNYYHPRDYHY